MLGWLRRKRRLKLLDADARVARAEQDLADAEQIRDEARELGQWARSQNRANRFDLRLEAAYRLQAGHHD